MMLDEQGASRRGSPGVGSPATGRHLKPRHRKIPVSEHRSRTREHKLVHYTHRPIPDVVRRSRGPFTHLCRAERECKSAKVALSPAQTTVLSFRCWSERKVVLDCLYNNTIVLVGEFTPPLGRTTESRPLLPSWRQRTSTRQNNKFISELLIEINAHCGRHRPCCGSHPHAHPPVLVHCLYRPPHTGGEGEAEAGRRGAAPPCGGPDVRDQRNNILNK